MIRLLYTEIFKMKNSKMFLISLLGALVSPVMTFFMLVGYKRQNPDSILSFGSYFNQTHLFIAFVIGNMLFALIVTYIYNREFEEDTLKNLLTIPISRVKLIISKLVILFLWIEIILLVSFLSVTIIGLITGFQNFTFDLFSEFLYKYLFTGFLFYLLVPSFVLVTLVFKGYVPTIAFSIFVTIGTIIFGQSKYLAFYPWGLPVHLTVSSQEIVYPIIYSWIILAALFIISIVSTIIYFNHTDIN